MKNKILFFTILVFTAIPLFAGCGGAGGGAGAPRKGTISLTWDAPTENADGTTLTDIAGYRVYFGEAPSTYPNSVMIFGTGTTASVRNILYGRTTYFTVAAFNIYGYTSSYSNEFQITLPER